MVSTAVPSDEAPVTTARLLVVDDHPLVRRGLAELLADEQGLQIIGEAATATEALELIAQMKPDLVIVDITLQEGHGIELIKQIRTRWEDVRTLAFSMHDESLYAERAIRAGSLGFINKQEAPESVIDAIRQVLQGKIYLSSRMTDRMLRRLVNNEEATRPLPVERLSDRELSVFELIGQGVTTRQIATRLQLSVKTIETYRENIKAKLNLSNSSELVRHAVQWMLEKS